MCQKSITFINCAHKRQKQYSVVVITVPFWLHINNDVLHIIYYIIIIEHTSSINLAASCATVLTLAGGRVVGSTLKRRAA